MSFFFAKNATPSQKAGTVVIFIVSVLAIVGVFSRILIDEKFMKAAGITALLLSLVCIPAIVRPILRMQNKIAAQTGRPVMRTKQITIVLLFIFFIPFYLYFAFAKGLPVIGHYLLSSPGEMMVTIGSKASDYKTRDCKAGEIRILEYGYITNNGVCGFQQAHWESFKPGDKLILQGQKSFFGFSVKRYKLVSRSNSY